MKKNNKIVDAYNAIQPDADAKERIRAKLLQQQSAKKNNRRNFCTKFVAVAAAVLILFVVFGTNLTNQPGDIFFPENPFAMRVYAMELQPDGTYIWREIDFDQLDGWGMHYDGEAIFVGLGLWFEFEGENIRTIEFSLEEGFFATQYIGNRGEVPHTTSFHVSIPPDHTTSRLVMYGFDFDKIGTTITFGDTMPDDILLFWGSYDISYTDWWTGERAIIEIDVNVTFEDGETHNQPLIMDFQNRQGVGLGWMDSALFPDLGSEEVSLGLFTEEQREYVMEIAPLEHFTLLPDAARELDEYILAHEFYIVGYDPVGVVTASFIYHDIMRIPLGVSGNTGFVAIATIDDDGIVTVNAYSIPLN